MPIFDAQTIARGLPKHWWTGKSWMACCAALDHDDKKPSMGISDAPDGKVLVHCFSGCSQEAVIEGLRAKGLWPDATPQQKFNHEQRKRHRHIEHHRLILKIAKSDIKNQKAVSDRDRAQIKASIDFLSGVNK